jgi:hypothetical protein
MKQIQCEFQRKFHQRLTEDYNNLINRLRTRGCISDEIIKKLEFPELPEISLISGNVRISKTLNNNKSYGVSHRCLSIDFKQTRCKNRTHGELVCNKHDNTDSHLGKIFECLTELETPKDVPKCEDYLMMNIKKKHGRKYHQIPEDETEFKESYMPVDYITVNERPYILIDECRIYEFDYPLKRVGEITNNHIKWLV